MGRFCDLRKRVPRRERTGVDARPLQRPRGARYDVSMDWQPDAWWSHVERDADHTARGGMPEAAPEWASALATAARAELRLEIDAASAALESIDPLRLDEPWRHVFDLIDARVQARRANHEALATLQDSLAGVARSPGCCPATRARALHTKAVLAIRLNHFEEAEEDLVQALACVEADAPSRVWILDGLGLVYFGQGAWEEARRTFLGVIACKEKMGDALGVAITMGHLAHMDLALGKPSEASKRLKETIARYRDALKPLSLLRLGTFALQAAMEMGDAPAVGEEAERTAALLERLGSAEGHYLTGYAALAMARVSAMRGDVSDTHAWLTRAGERLRLPDQAVLLRYWEALLVPGVVDDPAWASNMKASFDQVGVVTEAEILTWLLLARRASDEGRIGVMRDHLGIAFDRAVASNNPMWMRLVDNLYGDLDPRGLSRRMVERFSGRSVAELDRTCLETVSIVFADLVNFTARSQELEPDEVMQTVRSLFQLSLPLAAQHRVRPLQYLGDGLLAACQGDDHEQRALDFAKGLVRRAGRVSRVRAALGETWGLDLRAGVASGPVVLGLLGTAMKQEYLAIGRTTNLAARLQAKAEPGEVVASFSTVGRDSGNGRAEQFALKGFPQPVMAVRFTL